MTEREKPYNVYADIDVATPEEMMRKARIITEISCISRLGRKRVQAK